MEGLIVRYGGKEYRAGFEDEEAVVTLTVNMRKGDYIVELGGMTFPEARSYYWMNDSRRDGNGFEIEIEVAEFPRATEPVGSMLFEESKERCLEKQRNTEPDWDAMLKDYRRIEAVLREEGIIE